MKTENKRRASRETVAQSILVGAGLLGLVLGAGSAALETFDVSVPRPLLVVLAFVLMVVASWSSLIYWRNLDEAAREAHKFAWFWGASAGMIVAIPVMALLSAGWLEAVSGPLPTNSWMMAGMMTMLGLQVVGYGVAWAGWWWMRRR